MNKNIKKKALLIVTVIAILISSVCFTGCSESGTEKEETKATSVTKETTKKAEETQETTEKANSNSTQKATEEETEASGTSNSKNNNKKEETKATTATESTNNSSDKIQEVVPDKSEKPNSSDKNVLTVNGKKCKVGDTISVVLNLKTPVVLVNFQGYTTFDTDYLQCTNVKMNVNGLSNIDGDRIRYNGSDINTGYDFTGYGTLYTAEFKVLKKGTTTIKNTFEVISDMDVQAVDVKKCTSEIVVY